MFPIAGDIRGDLHARFQRAQETVLGRINYDSHMASPDHHVPWDWVQDTLKPLYAPVESARGRIWVVHADQLIK